MKVREVVSVEEMGEHWSERAEPQDYQALMAFAMKPWQ